MQFFYIFYINLLPFIISFKKLSNYKFNIITLPCIYRGVDGVAVSIVAFQAADPGSTPGRRTGV